MVASHLLRVSQLAPHSTPVLPLTPDRSIARQIRGGGRRSRECHQAKPRNKDTLHYPILQFVTWRAQYSQFLCSLVQERHTQYRNISAYLNFINAIELPEIA